MKSDGIELGKHLCWELRPAYFEAAKMVKNLYLIAEAGDLQLFMPVNELSRQTWSPEETP
jgi:hypothetical protein